MLASIFAYRSKFYHSNALDYTERSIALDSLNNLLTSGKLHSYLSEVDYRAEAMLDSLVKKLLEKEGITEILKANSPMEMDRQDE